MKASMDCYVCLMGQAITAARQVQADEPTRFRIVNRVLKELVDFNPEKTPAVIADFAHRFTRQETGVADPFREAKQRATQEALALYPHLNQLVKDSNNPFETAVRLAIAGNILDLALLKNIDLEENIDQALREPLAIDHTAGLRQAIEQAEWVLYLADNAGETVFDRLLIEQIAPKPVKYVVKGGPASNDVTLQDAVEAGLDQVAEIVTTGYDSVGIVLDHSSPEFLNLFQTAPVIILKGMGNFESLNQTDERMFFLLQAKCDAIANFLNVAKKGNVVLRG
jgi:uncharacterized protein with ATP-grasp and redox domains